MKCNSCESFFEIIANKTRIKILELLKTKDMSVSEIYTNLNEEQSKISHNLKRLSACNIVTSKKSGKKRIYSLNKETILPLLKIIDNHVEKYCCLNCTKTIDCSNRKKSQ
jgi:DNA-binding transcriptional ArsR family regulator